MQKLHRQKVKRDAQEAGGRNETAKMYNMQEVFQEQMFHNSGCHTRFIILVLLVCSVFRESSDIHASP